MSKFTRGIIWVASLAIFATGVTVALGGEKPHQVLVCKYVSIPYVHEILQTGQNPIVVDTHSIKGFDGSFPFAFNDKQGLSVAIRYLKSSEKAGDKFSIEECAPSTSQTPKPTPKVDPSPTPSGSPTATPKATPTPSITEPGTPSSPKLKAVPNTAFAK